jgi:tricorn protease
MLTAAIFLCVAAQSAPNEMRLLRNPDIYGDKVVFTYASDLWLADLKGGPARRLTSHPGNETYAKFSPDGTTIAFTGTYEGNADVYVMPAEGGEPKRLTYDPEGDSVRGWTPDGKIAYTSSNSAPWYPLPRLWLIKPTGGLPISTNVLEIADLSFSPDGKKLAYNRFGSHQMNWRRYRGGSQGVISIWDFATGAYSELPHGREQCWQPMWVGDSIYYASNKNLGTVNLYKYDTKSKQTKEITKFDDADVQWPSTDGKRIVFEKGGYLMTYSVADGKLDKVSTQILSDNIYARPSLKKLGNDVVNLTVSPSGKRVIVEARGELFSVPAKTGETRNMTQTNGVRETTPQWSPDGKSVAYLSDATGEVCLYTMPQMGGDSTKIATDPSHRITSYRWSPDGKTFSYTTVENELYLFDIATKKAVKVFSNKYGGADGYDWSPDCKWIAFLNAGDNLHGAVYLYEIATQKTTKVTEGYFSDGALSFDLSGKYLYLISARTFNPDSGDFEYDMGMRNSQRVYIALLAKDTPNPFTIPVDEEPAGQKDAPKDPAKKEEAKGAKIDVEDLSSRILPLPLEPGRYDGLVGVDGGVLIFTQNKLVLYSVAGRSAVDVVAGVRTVDFNTKRDKMAFLVGPTVCVSDVRPGIDPNAARVNTSAVEAIIDPRAEWKQIFWEAWRFQRDNFYDPKMLGLDWRAIGENYEKMLPYLAHRNDLNYVLGMMIAELGTSHAYLGGGDMGGSGVAGIPTGSLGADYEAYNGFIRFKKIYRGFSYDDGSRGPLGDPGVDVKEGEFLVAIDGKPLTDAISPDSLLVGKAGRTVTLKVNSKASLEGAREVRVRTIASDNGLRYNTWVENNRRKVAELSGGRIGYMHVPNTSEDGMIGFVKGYYSQSDKQAMIVDERFNGGGSIPTFFIEKLQRKLMTGVRGRQGADVLLPAQTVTGPMAMLINGYAGSGGDLFPWFFRDAKLGPLIGKRTWGGLVGIAGGANFVDGGGMTSPSFGLFDIKTGEWIAENRGIDPDIDVDARPDLIAKGQDPQLEEAVKYLLKQLEKEKPTVKTPTGYPRVKDVK